MVASPQGGMDIEEVAESDPDAIYTRPIDIVKGIQPEDTEYIGRVLGFEGEQLKDAQEQMANMYELFIGEDATQVEINPFVVDDQGLVYCVDAKINFDDSAAFRHKDLFAQRDFSMEDPREVEASKSHLNYIGLDGNIACMVNGAGLAMATMDIINLHGGSPANFLDVGGGADEKQVEQAFKLLSSDPNVQAILVNIFGGIMKCDVIATGIVNAAKNLELAVPLVVRLEGTNVEIGNQILADSGLPIITASDLDDAAIKAVQAI
jgi:succinyl-CoA synthetase beta subunit